MRTAVFFLVVMFCLSALSLSQTGSSVVFVGQVDIGLGRANEVRVWGEDYLFGKTNDDYFSTIGLVNRQGDLAWSHGFDWSYFNINSIAVASSSYAVFALMDTIYKVDRQGNVQRVKTPSTVNNFFLYKGENGRYMLTIPDMNDPEFKFWIYDQDLNYHGEFVGASAGKARRILEKDGYYYVATDQYGGGTYSNGSVNLDKYDTSGALVWTTKVPDANRSDLILLGNRLYFVCAKYNLSDPVTVICYGELNMASGDTLWTRKWRAYGFPLGVKSQAVPINSVPFPDGQGFVVLGESTKPGQSNENANIATAVLIDLVGEVSSVILDSSSGIFNAGDWNSGRELVLAASRGQSHNSKLRFYNVSGVTGLEDEEGEVLLEDFSLSQNYPNPFNPETTIRYYLPEGGEAVFEVFDILGRRVSEMVLGYREVGSYELVFDGSHLPSGTYVYRLRAGDFIGSKKMMLMK